jgi:class 3 adenylate cyclase/predicted ATPase
MEPTVTEPPSGLVAMLFADVEGSTRLAAALGAEWGGVLDAYHEIVLQIVRTEGGWVDGTAGDGFFVTFGDVAAAGRAAVAIQRELRAHPWPATAGELKVRMGLHVGQVERGVHGYIGLEIHRAARVGAAAHGGQILMTAVASELLRDVVPAQALGAHRLKDFPAPLALFCAVVDGRGAAAFPPPRTLELREGNLPATATRLIGREHDLERVLRALQRDGERLVTVLGRGGVGKTSLALAAANDLIDDYEGGVWWIHASQERNADGLWKLITRACRINAEGSVKEAVLADLRSRGPLLLVLDSLEGISDARIVLDALLDRLPHVSVLAASQLPVRSARERRLQLDCLEQSDALALLARCAVRLDTALADDRACAELVELLDGLPLAIELAAGRLRLFHPAELVRQLRETTTVLQDRTRADRQQSLAAALDWTLGLLDRDANELFARLGVFAGPVELDDIEAVASVKGTDVISAVATLIDAALLHRVETGDGLVRFGFPEAVRQEASERLAARDAHELRCRHAIWQRDLVWPLRIYEIGESRAVQRAHTLAAETQAALEWSWRQDHNLWRQLALGRYSLAHRSGSLQEQRVLLDRLRADAGENRDVVDLVRQHEVMLQSEDADGLVSLFGELTDLHARFLCALNLTIALTWERRFTDALAWNERALALGRKISPLAQAETLLIKADTLLEAGRDQEAEIALAASENAIGQLRSEIHGLLDVVRAHLASIRGAHADALDGYARALTHAELVGDRATIETVLMNLIPALARAGRAREMLEIAGILNAISTERSQHGLNPADVPDVQRAVTDALERLGSEGEDILKAGAALEPASWVKRTCALTYA